MKWLIGVACFLVLVIIGISVYLQPNSFIGCGDRPATTSSCGTADAIVVVSGGNTVARTDAGIALYKNGWAKYLVLAGAAQDKTSISMLRR